MSSTTTAAAATGTGEVKIRTPPDFLGDRAKAKQFISSCDLYFAVNGTTYDTNTKKVAFALSFMTGGAAAAWKEQKLAEYTATGGTWPTWETFKTDFNTAFSAVADAATAKAELKVLFQDAGIDDYIAKFRDLIGRSGIIQEEARIEYFLDGLDKDLVDRIYLMPTPPTTVEGMYTAAANAFQAAQRTKAYGARGRERMGATAMAKKEKDQPQPLQLTLRGLNTEERERHIREGLCFKCHRTGHRSKDHNPDGTLRRGAQSYQPRFRSQTTSSDRPKIKRTGVQTYTAIRTMMASLTDEEREICMRNMEEEGF
jgi:hypothetical protein